MLSFFSHHASDCTVHKVFINHFMKKLSGMHALVWFSDKVRCMHIFVDDLRIIFNSKCLPDSGYRRACWRIRVVATVEISGIGKFSKRKNIFRAVSALFGAVKKYFC